MKRHDFVLVVFFDMFYCLVSFAVNVLVSIFSWVLLRWPLGNLARDLVIKTTMGHTGKATTARICYCSFRRFSEGNWVSGLGWIGTYWDILRILGLLERPLNDL